MSYSLNSVDPNNNRQALLKDAGCGWIRLAMSVTLRYGWALNSGSAAFCLAQAFVCYHLPQPFTAFALCAIAITFWYGGTKFGILAVLISWLIRDYLFEPGVSAEYRLLHGLVFLVFALLMILVVRWRNELPRMKPDQVPSGPNAPFLASTDNPVTYELSIVFVLSGLLLQRFLEAHFVGAPVSLLLCAVMLSGWFGGLGPGLFSSILAFLAFEYELAAPLNSFTASAQDIPRVFAFGISALFIGLLTGEQRRKTGSLRRARDELRDTYRELKMSNKALRTENTMRIQAEAALRESEQHFRDFVETGSDWLWETGPDHGFTHPSITS